MAARALAHVLTALAIVAAPALAAAQNTPLSEVLVDLIQADIRLAPPTAPNPSHEAHFLPGVEQQIAPFFFNQAIITELSSFPIGSSSGGFSYSYDSSLGTFTRSTTTFGPSFAERAVTVGRRRFTLGANYQFSSYNSFEGEDLDDGSIKFHLSHEPTGGQFFEGDIIEAALRLELSKHSFVMFGSYGLTDRLELGVAVPVVSVKMNANVDATILRLSTAAIPGIHRFPDGGTTATYSDGGSASGVGDILIRAKYQIAQAQGGGLAVGVDLRTPTGNEDDLLGTGAAQAKFLLIGSSTRGTISPHFNVGYTFSGSSDSPFINVQDELNYVGGIEYAPSIRVTVAADFVGRTLVDAGRLELADRTFGFTTNTGQQGSTTVSEFALQSTNLNLSYGAVGVKVNPARNLVLSFNALLPLTKAGIRANITPVIGFDYTF
jgi:hypothetical protein